MVTVGLQLEPRPTSEASGHGLSFLTQSFKSMLSWSHIREPMGAHLGRESKDKTPQMFSWEIASSWKRAIFENYFL